MTAFKVLVALLSALGVVGCSRFVWKEDPFTPDQAPVTEIIAEGRDTTYVVRGASYHLLAQERSALWNREVMDDVAWRYRALFAEAPPPIAVRLDSVAMTSAVDTTWRGLPLATVALRRPSGRGPDSTTSQRGGDRHEAGDSVRARLLAAPLIAATAADTWLDARTLAAVRRSESRPVGPERAAAAGSDLPAWLEAAALRIIASGGAPDRAAAELRANQKGIVPLGSLFAVRWERRPNAMEIVRSGPRRFDPDDVGDTFDGPAPERARAPSEARGDVSPLFVAQSVSLLTFIHERDGAIVAHLADELPRGASVADVLRSSTVLPHDVLGLEAEWRTWLKRSARRR